MSCRMRHRFCLELVRRSDRLLSGMGKLLYDGVGGSIAIEDRALAHLKVVISTKLRRNESFTLSWHHPEGEPEGRSTIWLHPSIPVRFIFDTVDQAELNPVWVEKMMHSANSTGGITLVDEFLESAEAVPA